jgi:hypothetical protein
VVNEKGNPFRPTNKRSRLRYFFLNGELHKKVRINRGADLLVAYNYTRHKQARYTYTDTLRHHERAFTTKEVAWMLNRERKVLNDAIQKSMIRMPAYSYSEAGNKASYFWREKDIMEVHAYLATIHRGRPRKDGETTPQDMPTPRELKALIHNEEVLAIKKGDTYVPRWRAKDF